MVQAEFISDASKPFFVPRVFSGFNLFLDQPQLLPDAVDLVARECRNKKAFIVTDAYAVRFAPKIKRPYEKRHNIQFKIWSGSLPDAPIESVRTCAEKINAYGPDLIFAVCGGSSIDTAKAAWLLYEHPSVKFEILSP
ncbi:MAG: iron-containing alcohol dehydrogenase, partial [Desulfobacterales bacterium]